MNTSTVTPEVHPALPCLLRTQDRLCEILADVGSTLGNEAAAAVAPQIFHLFSAIKDAAGVQR